MMKATLRTDLNNAVQALLGDDVLIVKHNRSKVNSQVTIQSWLVNYPEQQLPNQFGKLDSQLQDGGGVQLMYLQHHFTELTSAVVYSISFSATFLADWNQNIILAEKAFNDNHSGLQVPLCNNSKLFLNELLEQPVAATFEQSLRQMELSLALLRKATEHISKLADKYAVPACSFLSNNSEREKVLLAREILEEEFEQTVTIKELSRRVAINECYLKKGFKAMFGKTIHEFQQDLRISKAKRLLQTDGYTVSEVASILGYSSISHFSTAFKKATSMKPCELLK
jgi:AraC-like DNA-binding protein